ncbi:MAG: ABC transporter substrate-binding protein [Alphaproteobacteria bacterium]|nr:ABC transporter substrate-binding protein [Alphaproteobacteria bacterium]
MPVIGYLGMGSRDAFNPRLIAFHKGLAAGGFVENQNVRIEYRWANDVAARLPALAADLVSRNVDVIATGGGPAPAMAAEAATSTVPIVFATPGSDPIELGLVTSVNRPTGNITGVGFLVSTISAKQIEIMGEAVPNAKLLGLLINPHNPNHAYYIKNVEEAENLLGRKVFIARAETEANLTAALANLVVQRVGALIAIPDVFFFRLREQLVSWASRNSIPGIYGSRDFPEAGGLMSYGTSIDDGYRQEGLYVSRILKGERPADLPVQQAVKIALVINLKTAKTLGLSIPITLLGRADEIIE